MIIVAVANELADKEAHEVTNAASTIAHNATCTITPWKRAGRETALKLTETPDIQKTAEMTNNHATTAVPQNNSDWTESTLTVHGINATMSTQVLCHKPQLGIATYSDWPTIRLHSPQPLLQVHESSIPKHVTI